MERIFYKADVVDAYTGYPYYIFDTSYLPSTDSIDYELFIPTLMEHVPREPYVVLMFSGGLNKISWIWGIKFLKSFLDSSRNVSNLHKIIAVHESWFVKSIGQILTNLPISKKSLSNVSALFDLKKLRANVLTSCETLADLSAHVDVTRLKLSLNIYKHDAHITLLPNITLYCPVVDLFAPTTTFSASAHPTFYHHFYQIFHIVDTYGHKVELLFHRPGKRLSTDILYLCLSRNQLLWINDWDLYCIASCFKKILREVAQPLLPVDMVTLPMKDDLEYTLVVFNNVMANVHAPEVLFQILLLADRIVANTHITGHTNVSILRSFCHALTHESVSLQNKDMVSIAVRFLKNLLHHWLQIRPLYQGRFSTVQQIVDGEELQDATIDELYNMSHEITMKDEDSTDEDLYISGNVLGTNILGNSSVQTFSSGSDTLLDETPKLKSQSSTSSLQLGSSNSSVKSARNTPPKITEKLRNLSVEESPAPVQQEQSTRKTKLQDISNVQLQFPPQKYKFEKKELPRKEAPQPTPETPKKLPVIRGRKVGELTKLFEQREQAMEILRTM